MARSDSKRKVEKAIAAQSQRGVQARRSLILALAVTLIVAALVWAPVIRALDWLTFDYMSTYDPPKPREPRPIIVAIDEQSFAQVNISWPWPRSLHAELVKKLRAEGAKAIGFDIIFAEPSDPAEDEALAAALGPDVVLAATISGNQGLIGEEQAFQLVSRIEPHQMFTDETGAGVGMASITLDEDGIWRQMPNEQGSFASVLQYRSNPDAGPPDAPESNSLIQFFDPFSKDPLVLYPNTISYYQVLEHDREKNPGFVEGFFKDRVVLVGLKLNLSATVSRGAADVFPTPLRAKLQADNLVSGVEVQATIFENLRDGLYLHALPPLFMAALAALITLGAGLLNRNFTGLKAILTVMIGVPIIVVAGYFALRYGRMWIGTTYPVVGILAAVGTQAGYNTMTERLARSRLTDAFGHYLSPAMVEKLAEDPGALRLGGEIRELTILFCDLRGFTTISERFKGNPQRLTYIVNRALTVLTDEILATHGTIDKYIGDCVMAFWNAPLPDPEHARHAAEASLRMIEAVKKLNRDLAEQALNEGWQMPDIAVGVGLNTGECVVGNLGSEHRFDYSALGDAVNLASRLEGLSKDFHAPIIISEVTQRRIAQHFETRELDRVKVKGRDEPVTIYTIVGPKANA